MALIDVQAQLSDEQAVTVTAFGTNWYDTGAAKNNLGSADTQRLRVTVDETVTAAGAATVTFELVEADDDSGTGVNVLSASGAIGKAALVAGAVPYDIGLPDNSKRYVGIRYTVATGPLTAGKFTAAFGGPGSSGHQRRYTTGYPNPFA